VAAAGDNLSADFAVRADGSIAGWGNDTYGMLDIPAAATNVVAMAAGDVHLLALREDGRVVSWGTGDSTVPDDATNVVAIAVEGLSGGCLALRQDGTIVVWGGAGAPPGNATNIIAIAAGLGAGGGSCLAVRQDGTVVGWGDDSYGETSPSPDAANVIAVACGEAQSLALRTDGTVVTFGGGFGSSDPPSPITNAVEITAASQGLASALLADGTVIGWGSAGVAPAFLTNCAGISSAYYHNTVFVQDSRLTLAPKIIQQPLGSVVQTNQTIILLTKWIGSLPINYQCGS